MLTFPLFIMHFVVILIFLIFCEYAAYMPYFAREWYALQLTMLRGYMGDGINATLNNQTLSDSEAMYALRVRINETHPHVSTFDGVNGTLDTQLTAKLFVEKILFREIDYDEADRALLAPHAQLQLDEWDSLRATFAGCFGGALAFFILGMFFNCGLTTWYLRRKSYADHFVTERVWRSSLTSSSIATFGLGNAGFLNALTQDADGYAIVRRDSAASHIIWHGLPILGFAGGALAALDCGHRPCEVGMRGSHAEFYIIFALVMTVLMIWWQFMNLIMSLVTRFSSEEELEQSELDLKEPKVAQRDSVVGWGSLVLGYSTCFIVWLFEFLCILGMYWNTSALQKPAYLDHLRSDLLEADSPGFDWGFDVGDGRFQLGLCFWLLGMLLNMGMVASYLGLYASQTLRRTLREHPALSVLSITGSAIHPEAMCFVADRRKDVMTFRKMGIVPVFTTGMPLAITLGELWGKHIEGTELIGFTVTVVSMHGFYFLFRSLAVMLTDRLRRTSVQRKLVGTGGLCSIGDAFCLAASLMQFMLVLFCLALWIQAAAFGPRYGIDPDHVPLLRSCYTLLILLGCGYFLANWFTAYSFLNHFAFSHERISDRSYTTATVITLCTFDGSWLTMLAQDAVAEREVKRVSMVVSLLFLLPVLLLQLIVFLFAGIDFDKLKGTHAVDAGPISDWALSLTIVMAVWRLLLVVILYATREAQEASPFHHTLCVGGSQWQQNRQPPEGWEDPSAPVNRHRTPQAGGREPADGGMEGEYYEGDGYDVEGQEGYGGEGGYSQDCYSVTNTSASWSDYPEGATQDATLDYVDPADLLEAVCLQRALYMTPDGYQGIFVSLPTAEDQPVPFLFVRAHSVQALKKRFGGGTKVTITFNSAEVGGLDADFVQQNVANNPEAAWEQLQQLEGGDYVEDGYEGGGDYADGGYEGAEYADGGYAEGEGEYAEGDGAYQQEAAPDHDLSAYPQEALTAEEQLMTPRTLAAQRL